MHLSTLKSILRTLENLPETAISDTLELIEAIEGAFTSGNESAATPVPATQIIGGGRASLDSVVCQALQHPQWQWRSIQALADAAKNAGLTVTGDAIREAVTRVGGRRNRREKEVYGLVTRVGT